MKLLKKYQLTITILLSLNFFISNILISSVHASTVPASWNYSKVPWVTDAQDFFVSVSGSPSGDGSINNPWDIVTAFSHPPSVQPGDIIWLRGGTYDTGVEDKRFLTYLVGTETEPIIIRGYPGERAIIDGGIGGTNTSQWNTFWGFEITNSGPREILQTERNSVRPPGLGLSSRGHKVINMVIHDTGHPGIGFWGPVGDGGEIHGSIIWGNGSIWTDESNYTTGSAIYAQNDIGTRYITDTIAFWNFSYGIKPGATAGPVNGFHLEGNIAFHNCWNDFFNVGSGAQPSSRFKMINNYTYSQPDGDKGGNTRLGYSANYQNDAEIRDNYFVGGPNVLSIKNWQTLSVTNNTFITASSSLINITDTQLITQAEWDNNNYRFAPWYVDSEPAWVHPFHYAGYATFQEWQSQTGYDENSTYLTTLPAQPKIVVRPNQYEPGRAHIIVYNWDLQDTVSIDVSSLLTTGDSYELMDVQNLFGDPVDSGTYDGNPLVLPMNLTEKTQLFGTATHFIYHQQHTAPEFAVFLLTFTSTPSNFYDLDGDGQVNGQDVIILLQNWISGSQGDFNSDTKINSLDYAKLITQFDL